MDQARQALATAAARSRAMPATTRPHDKDFPIVCVGGSAGGLDAYIRLLKNLPPDMGVALVIVNHMRSLPTQLHAILPQFTSMPVELITERLVIEPDHVFIIPENRDLHVADGEFHLAPISKPRGWPDVITVFLRSLTRCWDGKLVAVIVSGYDGDGAAALCGIQQVGGITIAQQPATARQPDMPRTAIASGCIDLVLSPENIARELVRIARADAALPRDATGKPIDNAGQQRPADHDCSGGATRAAGTGTDSSAASRVASSSATFTGLVR